MHFRSATQDDLEFLIQGFHETHGGLSHASEEEFRGRLKNDFFVQHPKATLLILEEKKDKVGYVLFSQSYFASTGPVLWVSQAYVAPEFRGKGSRALLNAMKDKAKELGALRLIWATDAKKSALSPLWKRIGAKDWTSDYTFWGMKP